MNKRRQGIRPFQKLIPSAWMSANIAYVKEMDYLGARLTGGTPSYDAGLTPLASACRGGASCSEEGAPASATQASRLRRRDLLSSKLHACETSDANSGASNAQAEPRLNSDNNVSAGI